MDDPSSAAAVTGSLVDSTPLLADPIALRARGQTDGYLFFKQLLPAADLLEVRRDVLDVVDRHGWRQPGQDELGGLIDVTAINRVPESELRSDIGVTEQAYGDVMKLESVHRLPHHPAFLRLYETLFGAPVLVHPRHILRMITPHAAMTPTPPHQDFPLIQGTEQTWTCWFPLGDCPREMGGLTVLRGSHRLGYIPVQWSKGAGNIAVQFCPSDTREWLSAEFEAGDILTFPSLTVHRALRCDRKDSIRLSMDIRFQAAHDAIEERSLLPHCALGWEEIYAQWPGDDLKYYWREKPLRMTPYDTTLTQPSRRIC